MYIVIGLDLSFSSTGVTCTLNSEENGPEKLTFARIIFDDEECNHKFKNYINVNTFTYKMPKSLNVGDAVIDLKDENNVTQVESTLKAMSSAKVIFNTICKSYIEHYLSDINHIVVCIENYIMPSFGGRNSLPEVSGLIMLQTFIREYFIKYCLMKNVNIKMLTPSPSTVKKFFANNGKAEKIDMMKAFLKKYDGIKLLPTIDGKDLKNINDVIDSFAMNVYAYNTILTHKDCLKTEY